MCKKKLRPLTIFLVQCQAEITGNGAIRHKGQKHGEILPLSGGTKTTAFAAKGAKNIAAIIGITQNLVNKEGFVILSCREQKVLALIKLGISRKIG